MNIKDATILEAILLITCIGSLLFILINDNFRNTIYYYIGILYYTIWVAIDGLLQIISIG